MFVFKFEQAMPAHMAVSMSGKDSTAINCTLKYNFIHVYIVSVYITNIAFAKADTASLYIQYRTSFMLIVKRAAMDAADGPTIFYRVDRARRL